MDAGTSKADVEFPVNDEGSVDLDLSSASRRLLASDAIRRAVAATTAEHGRKLAQRLGQSVLPLFIEDERGRPDRLGSCVLVRVDSNFYAFTAGHVLQGARHSRLWASPGPKGKLLPLPCDIGYQTPPTEGPYDLDVGILPLRAGALGAFKQCVFLTGPEIDEDDRPDDRGLAAYYFVFGYPASRSQVKVSSEARRIQQISFQLTTSPPTAEAYLRESLPQSDYLMLDFDHKDTRVAGKVVTPPKLQGVSGGGFFHISRSTVEGPLVAIATEHRRISRCLLGTRIKHFLTAARQLNATAPPGFFE
jgi:hypothetical protein